MYLTELEELTEDQVGFVEAGLYMYMSHYFDDYDNLAVKSESPAGREHLVRFLLMVETDTNGMSVLVNKSTLTELKGVAKYLVLDVGGWEIFGGDDGVKQ